MHPVVHDIAIQAEALVARETTQPIGREPAVAQMMLEFERECDAQINATSDESRRQMWNRAVLKALRISALLAVADNWAHPCITVPHAQWAREIVYRDIQTMRRHLESGDVGSSDTARDLKIRMIMRDYLVKGPGSYKLPEKMFKDHIVPRSYLQTRSSRVASFYKSRNGANKALDDAINTAIANGYIIEVTRDKLADTYGFIGKAYRIIHLPEYTDLD